MAGGIWVSELPYGLDMVALDLPLRVRGAGTGVWLAGCDCSEGSRFCTFCRLDLRGDDDCSFVEGCGELSSSAVTGLLRDEGGGRALAEVDWTRLESRGAADWSTAD
jgi:hypothetical protein